MREALREIPAEQVKTWSMPRHRVSIGIGSVLLVTLTAACNASPDTGKQPSRTPAATATGSTRSATPNTADPRGAMLPPHKDLNPQTFEDLEDCKNFWLDEEGKRRPLESTEPPVIKVDSRCNTPFNSEVSGIYPRPVQEGEPSATVINGDALLVIGCVEGKWVQDARGKGSDVWLDVVTREGANGLFPEVNAGFFDEQKFFRTCEQ